MTEKRFYSKLSQHGKSKTDIHLDRSITGVHLPRNGARAACVVPLTLVLVITGLLYVTSHYNHSPVSSSKLQHKYGFRDYPYSETYREWFEQQQTEPIKSESAKVNQEPWKEPALFTINFTWIKNNEEICMKGTEDDIKVMPVLVHTARSHFEERLVMRKSWGSLPTYKKWDIRFVFLMGQANASALTPSQLEEEENRLTKEHEEFGDTVIASFVDSYENLTLKHLSGYKWILNYCREAAFVMKVDDDVFIDIMTWLDWITADMEKLQEDKSVVIPDLYCKIWKNPKPFRKKSSKWYVSYDVWPDKYYPNFCSGWAYTLSVELIEKLYLTTFEVKFNWIDDVYVTGQLIEKLKESGEFIPEIKDISENVTLYTASYQSECKRPNVRKRRKFKVVAKVDRGSRFESDMMCMWNKVLYDRGLLT